MEKILETVQKYILYIVIALLAVFSLPNFASPIVVPKEILLVIGLGLAVFVWAVNNVVKGEISLSVGKFDLVVLLFAAAYTVSSIIATPNKIEAYFFPGLATFVLSGVLIYFLINQFSKKDKEGLSSSFFVAGLLSALSVLAVKLKVFSVVPQLPSYIKDVNLSLLGGSVPTAIFLGVLVLFTAGMLIKEKDLVKKIFLAVSLTIIILSLSASISDSLPGKPTSPRFAGIKNSWEVSVESIKKNPLWGVGPGNYLTAFNLYRPISYNATNNWQLRFSSSSSFYLTMIAETGILGIIAILILLFETYRFIAKELEFGVRSEKIGSAFQKLSLVTFILSAAFLTIPGVLIPYLFILLAFFSKSDLRIYKVKFAGSRASRVLAAISGVPFIAGLGIVIFIGSKFVSAEVSFKKSLDALALNDAQKTYNLMIEAVNKNNKVDRYHLSLAQIDLALASSLASKPNLNDNDRKAITQFVQLAINEGKAAVAVNPGRSGNWEALAGTYKGIMSFAQGADRFAIQTYTQAVALDPTNPNLRINLGGVYYALGRFDEAIDAFKLAVAAKPDLANAHYNLAIAYREKKDFDKAIAEMNTVLTLVQKDSADYKLAQTELENLEKNKPANKTQGETLTPPTESQGSNINPPITLPESANPPSAE